MTSRTQLIRVVRELRSDEVRQAVQADPSLAAYRDERGRSLLHICCSVDIAGKKLSASGSVRMAQALLDAGLDVNEAAFREGNWKATPLWYTIARGRNLKLARFLLERGSDPNHCLWAAAHREDVAAIEMLLGYGARGDLRNSKGHTAFEIMSRKRDPAFRRMGESLTAGPGVRA